MAENPGNPPLTLDDLDGITLSASQAYLAMSQFLNESASRLRPETALVTILSGMSIEGDRMSGDPAALSDWVKCVEDVLNIG